ncbi:MAG: Heavy metal transporter [Firmicutes bacterium]|nr:Heavy metal transporter [Bacillota bacterium]
MSSNVITITLRIRNMTCVNCENIIEQELSRVPGVQQVKASYSSGTAVITYDESVVNLSELERVLEKSDYYVNKENSISNQQEVIGETKRGTRTMPNPQKTDYTNLVAVLIIMFAVYMIANRFGLLNIFNSFPIAKEGMGYGMLFVIGLLTSVHCVAMCGGICLSQCVPKKQLVEHKLGRFEMIQPSLLYNFGRVISYTVIGGIVGGIGSVVSFSGTMKGLVQLLAGVFMVIMGLNMLNIFPGLRKFNPRMPKIFAKTIYAKKINSSPLYIGILNGLMPCGPLQAMQLYALSTGSPIKGAISMFLFSVGTFPLMFLFGALSSLMNKKFSGKLMKASAVLVVVLGMFMFSNGISLAGITIPSLPVGTGQAQAETANIAKIENGVQVVTTGLSSGRYEPIIVQKGIPVKWTIQAEDGDINGCNKSIVVPKYNIQKDLATGANVIEFTPEESGVIPYSCWMGMIRSKITVVDDINSISDADLKNSADTNSGVASGGGCCGTGGAGAVNGAGAGAGTGAGNGTASGSTQIPNYNNILDVTIPTKELAIAKVKDGVQTVQITLGDDGFTPAVVVVQKGLDTQWVINGKQEKKKNSILFPYYSAQLDVQPEENKINFYPDQDFDFFTEDSAYYGYVKVVEDINNIDVEAIKQEVSQYKPSANPNNFQGGAPSCH